MIAISTVPPGTFEHLMKRVDPKAVKAMVEETASSHSETAPKSIAPAQAESTARDGVAAPTS